MRKKKIIITGGLGYIGTELCKLYSGVSWFHNIIIIDNRFISERVNQIRNWNMEFVQGDILDKSLIEKYFQDADVVHHLAGITDVPRIKSDATLLQDEKIKKVGEEGTKNILETITDKCKIIFPSTHVVFEGIEKIKKNIEEDEFLKPVLSYSSSKAINEKQLKESKKRTEEGVPQVLKGKGDKKEGAVGRTRGGDYQRYDFNVGHEQFKYSGSYTEQEVPQLIENMEFEPAPTVPDRNSNNLPPNVP